jgi:ketosteroid isomerase-like protein
MVVRDKLLILAEHYLSPMKIFLTLLVCSMLSTTEVLSQSADEKAVAAAVEKLRKAMIAGDPAQLKSMAAEDLSYGHSNALIENRDEFVDQFVTGKSVFKTIKLTDQTIKIVGDAAVVRHRLTADTNNSNVPGTVDLTILMVWKKQNGEWKLLARQAAKIPPKS